MRRIFQIILVLIVVVNLVSCKTDKKEKRVETEEITNNKNEFFSAELSVVVLKDDNFTMYFTEDGSINFTGDNAVWSGVKGKNNSQNVKFILSGEKIPTNIRFDLGMNKDQQDVILESFKLDYYGKTFEAKGSDFLKYFIQNDSIKTEIDEVKGTIKFLRNSETYLTPFYYPHQLLLDEISKITN